MKAASTFELRGTLISGFMGAQRIRRIYPKHWYLIYRFIHFLRKKIDANLPQRRHRPRRHPRPVASVRLAEVRAQEVWIPVLGDGRADFPHQREQVAHVVHRQSVQAHTSSVSRSAAFCMCRFFPRNTKKKRERMPLWRLVGRLGRDVQMGAHRLLRSHAVDVRTRDAETAVLLWSAARTRAVCIYGSEVGGE